MTQEQIQQSIEKFNALSGEQKQEVWNNVVDRLSKVNLEELASVDLAAIDGGKVAIWPPVGSEWLYLLPYINII